MRCLGPLLLIIASLSTTSSTSWEPQSFLRRLTQTKKELAEIEREDNALEAYHLQQATLNKEQENLLHFGSEQAVILVKKFNKGNRKTQAKLFADLWENAEGVTIVKALAMLLDISPGRTNYFYSIINDSLDLAEDNGYGFKVSEALYHAMAVRDGSLDHYYLLDALMYRMEDKNADGKDAETWALDDGRAQQFFQGFDNKEYLPLVECFLPECTGSAAKCCSNTKAVSTGMCGCKVINKKQGTMQCEHNLYWTAPRTIWLCGSASCNANEKCLCPKPGPRNKRSTKKPSRRESQKRGAKVDSKESNKKSKKKADKKASTKTSTKSSTKSSQKGRSKTNKRNDRGMSKGKGSKRQT